MNQAKIKITILIVLVVVFGMQTARFLQGGRSVGQIPSLKFSKAKAQGNPQAGVRIVEYTDFQCPACAKGSAMLKDYFQMYPKSLYVQYRHFPLEMHPRAQSIAIAAECAARQDKFWAFHDLAFGRQNLLRETIDLQARLQEMAAEAGLDKNEFDRCLASASAAVAVRGDQAEGHAAKVVATPTYFLNGQMIVGGGNLRTELEKKVGRLP